MNQTFLAVAAAGIALLAFLYTASVRSGFPQQWAGPNLQARQRLAAMAAGWPADKRDATVFWHGLAALTLQDVREVLWERGWFPAGEEPDREGWPLHFTRDAAFATTTEPPPTREQLFLAELVAAADDGLDAVVVDLAPYRPLPPGRLVELAEQHGWSGGVEDTSGCVPRQRFSRDGVAPSVAPPRLPDVVVARMPEPSGVVLGSKRVHPRFQRWYNLACLLLIGGLFGGMLIGSYGQNTPLAYATVTVCVVAAVAVIQLTSVARRRARERESR